MEDSILLLSLIKDYWKGNYRKVSIRSIFIFIVALLYLVSPIDIINDFIPIAGIIDDAAVLSFSLFVLEKDLYKYKAWKNKPDQA